MGKMLVVRTMGSSRRRGLLLAEQRDGLPYPCRGPGKGRNVPAMAGGHWEERDCYCLNLGDEQGRGPAHL